jgi:hypothetical protein
MGPITSIVHLLEGQKLQAVRLYQVNDEHPPLAPGRTWAVDGGVELETAQTVLAFGWDQDLNQFMLRVGSLRMLSPDLEARPLPAEGLERVLGQLIAKAEADTARTEDWDGEPFEALLTLRIHFASGEVLRIAAVDVDPSGPLPEQLYSCLDDQLLVTLDPDVRIAHPPEGDVGDPGQ